nr:MAG TPA: hypothetical protein [Caudoviricetes sp.]
MEQTHPLDSVTADNYKVPQGEEGIFHVVLEVKEFDRKTGERTSVPRVQKFGVNAFETAFPNLKRLGYDVRVVYDPTSWLEEQAKRAEEQEQQGAQYAAEAQQAAIEAALEKQRKEFEEKQQAAIEKAVAEALKAQSAGGAAVAEAPSEEAAPKKGAK